MNYFDLHADTPHRLRHGGEALHIPPEAPTAFSGYRQVFACFADEALSNTAAYWDVLAMKAQFSATPQHASAVAYAVEDLRVLEGDLSRADTLFDRGFRIFTPLWRGKTCIGGAWDTDAPLTPFGSAAVTHLLKRGAYIDISHASDAAADELISLCLSFDRPPLATHSAARAVCPHPRNLSDALAARVIRAGGLIGLPLVSYFLSEDDPVLLSNLIPHISHFLSLGARHVLSLGCDLDGTTALPADFHNIFDVYFLADVLSAHFSDDVVKSICYENAARFFARSGLLDR